MNFNEQKLREIRQLFQMNYSDIADLLQVDFHRAMHFETGIETPNFNQIQILCKVFHVKSMYFYSESLLSGNIDSTRLSIRR